MKSHFELGEISDATYVGLLEALLGIGSQFGFVISRPLSQMWGTTTQLLDELSTELLLTEQVTKWPGTESHGPETSIRYLYRFTPHTLRIIVGASRGLFGWENPDLPGDLHILRADGSTVLSSVGGEGLASLEVTDEERRLISAHDGLSTLFDGPVVRPPRVEVRPLGEIGDGLDDWSLRQVLLPMVGRLQEPDRSNIALYLGRGYLAHPQYDTTMDVIDAEFEVSDGNDLLTDGVLFWRRDLGQYVARYGLEIDTEEIERMRAQDWMPGPVEAAELTRISNYIFIEYLD